jgi:Zn-finger nucleic acid-binding protein
LLCYRDRVPYRDADMFQCPACGEAMRAYIERLCCDACTGIFIGLEDLTAALDDHALGMGTIAFRDAAVGARGCPRCRAPMTTCHLVAVFGEGSALPAPELDRCAKHGVWFDVGELAKVLEAARHATEPDGVAGAAFARAIVELWESGKS